MKIIFLDIDGVLNTGASTLYNLREFPEDSSRENRAKFDPMACSNLNYLLETFPESKIVISSTWRKLKSLDELKEIFRMNKIHPDKIIGVTPSLGDRVKEIHAWCDENGVDAKETCAIDDAGLKDYRGYHAELHPYDGFLTTEMCRVIQHFGEKPPVMFF